MKKLITIAAVFTITNTLAQDLNISAPRPIEGGRLTTGETLPALSYDLGEIVLFNIDAAGNEMVVVSKLPKAKKDKQFMSFWDIKNKKALWTIELDSKPQEVILKEHNIIGFDGKRTKAYSKANGTVIWTRKDKLIGARENGHIAIGQKGELIDLKTGGKTVSTNIQREFGVNNAVLYKKQTLVVAADGLFGVHLPDGKTWGYQSKTGWQYFANLNKEVEASALGVAGAAAAFMLMGGGGFFMPYSTTGWSEKGELVYDAGSNIEIDNGIAYYASLENLTAVEIVSGKNIFTAPLPGSKTSRSYAVVHNDNVHLVNTGFAMTTTNKLILCGHPFVASFNKITGKQNFIDSIGSAGVLTSFTIIGDTLLANYQNKYITATDLLTGKRIVTVDLKKSGLPEKAAFINSQKSYVEQKDGTFTLLAAGSSGVAVYYRQRQCSLFIQP